MPGVRRVGGAPDVRRRGSALQGLGLLHHRLRQGREEGPAQTRRRRASTSERRRSSRESAERSRQAAVPKPSSGQASPKDRVLVTPDAIIRDALIQAARTLGAPDPIDPVVERPRDPAFGDWTTNLAMTLARRSAQAARHRATSSPATGRARAGVREADVAGPGFINFRARDRRPPPSGLRWCDRGRRVVRAPRRRAGRQPFNVEFVSANPTGPLHVGHGRQAALGDAIASLLEWTGWTVTREFYYNDAGVQIENLALTRAGARSLERRRAARDSRGRLPRRVHPRDRRSATSTAHPDDPQRRTSSSAFASLRCRRCARSRTATSRRSASSSTSTSSSRRCTPTARSRRRCGCSATAGHTYEKDGALWLRTTDFGDDKDRVMREVRDGRVHVLRARRRVSRHEVGARLPPRDQRAGRRPPQHGRRACASGCRRSTSGFPQGYPEYVLHQMVTVMRGGEEVKISKRAGSYVTVRDLVDEVGRDAVRYFFLMRKGDSQLVFDVDLARAQSEENPVYYIQMAHARMCGIFRVGEIDPASVTGEGVDSRCLARSPERRARGGAARLSATRARAPPKRSSRIAWRRTCTTRRAWFTSGTTRSTCWTSRKAFVRRASCWRARRRSCCATGSRFSVSRRRSACESGCQRRTSEPATRIAMKQPRSSNAVHLTSHSASDIQ